MSQHAELLRELRAIQPKFDPRYGKWLTISDSMLTEIIAALSTQDATNQQQGVVVPSAMTLMNAAFALEYPGEVPKEKRMAIAQKLIAAAKEPGK